MSSGHGPQEAIVLERWNAWLAVPVLCARPGGTQRTCLWSSQSSFAAFGQRWVPHQPSPAVYLALLCVRARWATAFRSPRGRSSPNEILSVWRVLLVPHCKAEKGSRQTSETVVKWQSEACPRNNAVNSFQVYWFWCVPNKRKRRRWGDKCFFDVTQCCELGM